MNRNLTELQLLAKNIVDGTLPTKFAGEDFNINKAEDMMRNAILDTCGGKFDFYSFHKNKWDVFAIISEVLTPAMGKDITDIYGELVEVRDTELGDTNSFTVEDNSLFRVALISNGNQDIRRQDIYSKKLQVETNRHGIKIFADIDMFLSRRINFVKMIERIQKSFENFVGELIADGVYNAYTKDARLLAPYKQSGSLTEDGLIDLITHVEAATGQRVQILGTAKALAKVPNVDKSDITKREIELFGYQGMFRGREMREIPQVHKAGTDTFAVPDDFLLIIPTGERIVKVMYEGQATVYDIESKDRNDEQIEMFFARRVGVAVLTASKYGYWRM